MITDSANNSPVGLFRFTPGGKFDGPALIVGDDGQPSVTMSFLADRRNGKLRTWDSEGALVLFSEYRAGKKSGLTCLCEGGRPVLIEDWGVGAGKQIYLVEYQARSATLFETKHLTEKQRIRLAETQNTLRSIEQLLKSHETKWKKVFNTWWYKAGGAARPLQARIDITQDAATKIELGEQLEKAMSELRSVSFEECEKLLSKF